MTDPTVRETELAFYETLRDKIVANEDGLFTGFVELRTHKQNMFGREWYSRGTPHTPPKSNYKKSTWRIGFDFYSPSANNKNELSKSYVYWNKDTVYAAKDFICRFITIERHHGDDGNHILRLPCGLNLQELYDDRERLINEIFASWRHGIMFEKEIMARMARK